MPKLDPEEKARREKVRADERKREMVSRWHQFEVEAQTLLPTVPAALAARKPLKSQQLWLLLALAETSEHEHLVKQSGASCQSRWFDWLMPTARPDKDGHYWTLSTSSIRRPSAVTSRLAKQMTEFIRMSGNGYAHLTALGLATAKHLLETYPALRPQPAENVNFYHPISVEGLATLPHTRWRQWFGEKAAV